MKRGCTDADVLWGNSEVKALSRDPGPCVPLYLPFGTIWGYVGLLQTHTFAFYPAHTNDFHVVFVGVFLDSAIGKHRLS